MKPITVEVDIYQCAAIHGWRWVLDNVWLCSHSKEEITRFRKHAKTEEGTQCLVNGKS